MGHFDFSKKKIEKSNDILLMYLFSKKGYECPAKGTRRIDSNDLSFYNI